MKKRNPKLTSWLVGAVFLASCGEPGTPTAPVADPHLHRHGNAAVNADQRSDSLP